MPQWPANALYDYESISCRKLLQIFFNLCPYFLLFNCSQLKFVLIIVVMSSSFMRFFA